MFGRDRSDLHSDPQGLIAPASRVAIVLLLRRRSARSTPEGGFRRHLDFCNRARPDCFGNYIKSLE
jgi:hypothetical protein